MLSTVPRMQFSVTVLVILFTSVPTSSGLAEDQCLKYCPQIYAPVCGTNGKSYSSECMLKADKCKSNPSLEVAHQGLCKEKKELDDQCAEFLRKPRCTKDYRPVCGSDGKTYSNKCMFCLYKNENLQRGLVIEYTGRCKAEVKRVSRTLNPECTPQILNMECGQEDFPLCASNGISYGNNCKFCKGFYYWQKFGVNLTVQHLGRCEPTDYCTERSQKGACTREYIPICANDGKTHPNLCTMCSSMYQQRQAGKNIVLRIVHYGKCTESQGDIEHICNDEFNNGFCTEEYFPLCGSDGKTYDNKCRFCYAKQQANNNEEELNLQNYGECKKRETRSNPFECNERSKKGYCTKEYFPVCGSNGITYGNKCMFCYNQHQVQQNGAQLEFLNFGECSQKMKASRSVEQFQCNPSMKNGVCTREYIPVCASDGKTYGNRCVFCFNMYSKQEKGLTITMNHFGECQPDDYCPPYSKENICTDDYKPVCASDHETYPNLCGMCSAMYQRQSQGENIILRVLYEGICKATEVKRSEPFCNPTFNSGICTKEYFPICGSDGQTYGNKCTFCYNAHSKQTKGIVLEMKHLGECQPKDYCPPRSEKDMCTKEYRPVCASDHNTYPNLCSMCAAMYAKQRQGENIYLRVIEEGECKKSISNTVDFCKPEFNSGICTLEYDPICGTDGKTYGNKCMFCFAKNNEENSGLEVDHIGKCEQSISNTVDFCKPQFNSGICTTEYDPICGTDGKTYGNKCMFCFAKNNEENSGLEVDHVGECEQSISNTVDFCKPQFNSGVCTQEYDPICGTDGKTYGNKCMFCFAKNNEENSGLEVDHIGECKTIEKRSLDDFDYECTEKDYKGTCSREFFPLCGNNGKTYSNKCTFCYDVGQYANKGKELRLSSVGECKPRRLQCTEMSRKGACTYDYHPVCANDGKTYSNECLLCAEEYRRQSRGENIVLFVKHDGEC